MQRLEVSCAVGRIYTSLGAKGLMKGTEDAHDQSAEYFSQREKKVVRGSGKHDKKKYSTHVLTV